MKNIAKIIKHEFLELLPPTIFFLIAFQILAISRTLMLRQYGISMSAMAGVVIGALVVAKVVLLADMLPIVNRFPNKPLIYNVLWKTAIYVVASILFHYLEHLIPLRWEMHDLFAANDQLLKEMIWPHFWVIQLWMMILLFLYCSMRELTRFLGPSEVRRIFFGHRGKMDPAIASNLE